MTEEQLTSPLIAAAFLTLFATFFLASVVGMEPIRAGSNLYMTIVIPITLFISAFYFAYTLYTKGHRVYMAGALIISLLLGGFFLYSYF
ncbi:MAG: hypothetical protein V4480_02910 [Patescibacteria group bacterium]